MTLLKGLEKYKRKAKEISDIHKKIKDVIQLILYK